MRAVDIIMNKRNGKELSREEIGFLIGGYVAGEIPDYQVSAWAMAVFFRGMTAKETAALTDLMLKSGASMDLSGISGPFVDKHSTGGVGDKTSLILAPIVAALGIKDPMMSGRALGHTGGTLDKLDAIPGYRSNLEPAEFRRILAKDGFAMTGQTKDIVPADRLLYALRDVTATVESIPLITASILSKKVAEGADALVFDVKFGSGAFMKDAADGEKLARSLVDTGTAMGKKIVALLTDMNEPLGNMMGNFLEVEESLDCLEGKGPADLMEVTLELAARMVVLGGKAKDASEGRRLCEQALAGGKPRELFLANIESQGGDVKKFLEMRGSYRSPVSAEIRAAKPGYIARIDAWKVGHAGVDLGVGRNRTEDAVSPTAGVQFHLKGGDKVAPGDLIMTVWARDKPGLAAALPQLEESVEYSGSAPAKRQLVLKEIG
ncbi:pyrimidine-nucleoside phosphorylase [Treponema primitia ZAS-2]|uniref:thymidine phosphorylase n=1 Tax=Treponema primitia (strain ATCC BAA-887 / DSM 12427 / ZAS-2) TaxID=545694 RepID=F5YHS0_TREPZ|nr:thymidine phosphorylase [Treponema primitia]AEF85894.1 pyrimidine-nucleoside phosphorylase [Treponema primitia ZAS-2]